MAPLGCRQKNRKSIILLDLLHVTFPVSGVQTDLFVPPAVAFIISFFTSMAGISGAFLLLPFQISILGFSTPSVTSTNFLFNLIGPPGGIYRYAREGRMAWPLAGVLAGGLLPGILAGYYFRVLYLPDPVRFKLFVAAVLMGIGVKLFWSLRVERSKDTSQRGCGGGTVVHGAMGARVTRFDFLGRTHAFSTPAMAGAAFLVGVIGGAYGIGGGAILAPLCVTIFGLPVYVIAGAVLLGTFVSSLAGILFYSLIPVAGTAAPPDWLLGLLFGVGGVAGIYCGAKAQRHVPERWIKLILGIIVFSVAFRYLAEYLGTL